MKQSEARAISVPRKLIEIAQIGIAARFLATIIVIIVQTAAGTPILVTMLQTGSGP